MQLQVLNSLKARFNGLEKDVPEDTQKIAPIRPYVWRRSPEYAQWWLEGKTSAKAGTYSALILTWAAVALIPIALWVPDGSRWNVILTVGIVALFFAAFIVAGSTLFSYWAARHSFYERMRAEKSSQIERELENLRQQGSRTLALADLFVINRRQLDEYHVTTMHEQRAAFRNAQIAAAVGFLLLAIGVTLVLQKHDNSARYAAAALTGVASLLSGFISSIFFKSYTDTTRELRHYYWEPLRTGQVLAVERLAGIEVARSARSDDSELRRALAKRMMEQLPEIPIAEEGVAPEGSTLKDGNGKKDAKARPNHLRVIRRKS